VNPFTLQFIIDALRTVGNLDLTMDKDRRKLSTSGDRGALGHPAIRNPDGTALSVAQIAAAANVTTAIVMDIAGRI
jgi:hypothetical protein